MINASDLGFFPGNDASANSRALQQAVDLGGEIFVDGRGIADIAEPIIVGSCVTLRFQNGIYLRRREAGGGYAFVNRGAFTGEADHHISIIGLRLLCCGVECGSGPVQTERTVPGLRGELSFYHVRNLEVLDLEIPDLPAQDFGVHVCDFEDLRVERVRIEGRKDGIHLGRGKRFVIRHGVFRTFDDPIALNAHDYASSNPELGWIEDGLIEDCYDLDDDDTTGFFCRVLAGSWCAWRPGMKVRHSDTVVSGGRLYRVYMRPDGQEYVSCTPPTHGKGTETLDGIRWVMTQTGTDTSCGCRRIRFRDIFVEKKRPVAFSFHFDKDNWSRSVYPGSVMPLQEDITFENVRLNPRVPVFLHARTPIDRVDVCRSRLYGAGILLEDVETEGAVYGETAVDLRDTDLGESPRPLLEARGGRSALCTLSGCRGAKTRTVRGRVRAGAKEPELITE